MFSIWTISQTPNMKFCAENRGLGLLGLFSLSLGLLCLLSWHHKNILTENVCVWGGVGGWGLVGGWGGGGIDNSPFV